LIAPDAAVRLPATTSLPSVTMVIPSYVPAPVRVSVLSPVFLSVAPGRADVESLVGRCPESVGVVGEVDFADPERSAIEGDHRWVA
jgi:hypothetical protein